MNYNVRTCGMYVVCILYAEIATGLSEIEMFLANAKKYQHPLFFHPIPHLHTVLDSFSQWILINDCVTISSILNIKYGMSTWCAPFFSLLFPYTTIQAFCNGTDFRVNKCHWIAAREREKSIFSFKFCFFFVVSISNVPPNWHKLTTESHSFTRNLLPHPTLIPLQFHTQRFFFLSFFLYRRTCRNRNN